MPNVKSARKSVKTYARDAIRNRTAKSSFRTSLKKANLDIAAANLDVAKESVHKAICEIGKCASKGIINKKKAARQESRLVKKARRAGLDQAGR